MFNRADADTSGWGGLASWPATTFSGAAAWTNFERAKPKLHMLFAGSAYCSAGRPGQHQPACHLLGYPGRPGCQCVCLRHVVAHHVLPCWGASCPARPWYEPALLLCYPKLPQSGCLLQTCGFCAPCSSPLGKLASISLAQSSKCIACIAMFALRCPGL